MQLLPLGVLTFLIATECRVIEEISLATVEPMGDPNIRLHDDSIGLQGDHMTSLPLEGDHMTSLSLQGDHLTSLSLQGDHMTSLSLQGDHMTSLPLQGDHTTSSLQGGRSLFIGDLPISVENNLIASLIAKMLWRTVESSAKGCHFVLVTDMDTHGLVLHLIRQSILSFQPLVLIDIREFQNYTESDFLEAFWSTSTVTCRTVLIDFCSDNEVDMLRFLENSHLWWFYEIKVFMVGYRWKVNKVLLDFALRNFIQPVYVALDEDAVRSLNASFKRASPDRSSPDGEDPLQRLRNSSELNDGRRLGDVFSRCLYCKNGTSRILHISSWPVETDVTWDVTWEMKMISDEGRDLQGHLLRIVGTIYYPFTDMKPITEQPDSLMTLLDSLDKRLLEVLSNVLNFKYEVQLPSDRLPGYNRGNKGWTGKIGDIQDNLADICLPTAPSAERLKIIDFTKSFDGDGLVIVSLKPEVLPQYLIITRPFAVDVWIYLITSILIWGASLWALQKAVSSFGKGKPISFSESMFYSWAVMLEDPPMQTPSSVSGQMMVGWWLVASLLISTGFRSSLVAHITVPGKTKPLNSFTDMIKRPNYRWGIDSRVHGFAISIFGNNPDPVVQYVGKSLEVSNLEDGLKRTSTGSFSLMATKRGLITYIMSNYADKYGQTPFYLSKQSFTMSYESGWGFRKGAPFYPLLTSTLARLTESGITQYWMDDLLAYRSQRAEKIAQGKQNERTSLANDPELI
ncbi:uncharacterized protein [Palaemon carinicauda]|uniref:uncharacterized protein isoform X2 n=1 Tax=Palaemon carinicauda TaxID=392227 RepID=UPI0035B6A013